VIISRVEREEIDSILDKFLAFLEGDLEKNPQQIKAIDADLVDRIENLVESVEIDLDAPLADEDE
jgi:antitoxin PrlF